jgi:hypothetical protein
MSWSGAFARCTWFLAVLTALGAPPSFGEPRVVDLVIRGGTLSPEQRTIRVQQGDAVSLRWTSDRALTLHLHGYDIERSLAPGTTTTMSFTASVTGRFSIEIHGSGGQRARTLGYLEVHPR